MEPIFFLVQGDLSEYFGMQEDPEVQILVQETLSDTDEESIDYDESSETLENEFDSDIEIIETSFEEDLPYPELQHALLMTKLEKLYQESLQQPIITEIEAEEDYITAVKFFSGQEAILITSAGVLYKQPLHKTTVKKLLESNNSRNPCDNNVIESFTLVKIK
jgi:hypothetical protein